MLSWISLFLIPIPTAHASKSDTTQQGPYDDSAHIFVHDLGTSTS
jgi:hypothetical protein